MASPSLRLLLVWNGDPVGTGLHVLPQQIRQRRHQLPNLPVSDGFAVPLDDGQHGEAAADERHLGAALGVLGCDVPGADAREQAGVHEARRQREHPLGRAPAEDLVEGREHELPLGRHERHVHHGALGHVPLVVHPHGREGAAVLGVHDGQHVGKVVHVLHGRELRRLHGHRGRDRAHPGAVHPALLVLRRDHHAVERRRRAAPGGQQEVAGPGAEPVADGAHAAARGGGHLDQDAPQRLARERGRAHARRRGRPEEAVQVRVQLVQGAVQDHGRVEHAVAPVDHVVVDGENHHGRVQDDAAEHARVHGRVGRRPRCRRRRPFLLHLRKHLGARLVHRDLIISLDVGTHLSANGIF
uniref:Uncharacterized protein n=1 Tax=Zea mays TaxID=4577 RepID=C0PCC5_MAIZE|nr:unknown [Zea mays]